MVKMEAATIIKKKTSVSKGKLKRSLRNVLCRPDPVFWPSISDDHSKVLESALEVYKVDLPEFKKPHWKEIQSIPKDQRPKPVKLTRVKGLIFGRTEVTTAVDTKTCSAILIESSVNPRTIVLPLIEKCVSTKLPILCLNGLRRITGQLFGIPTCCLGIKCDHLEDLTAKVKEIAKNYTPPKLITKDISQMDVDENNDQQIVTPIIPIEFKFLYRASKRTRVFNPSQMEPTSKKAFVGQAFIELTDNTKQKTDSKAYMNMILKKISSNQNRVKSK